MKLVTEIHKIIPFICCFVLLVFSTFTVPFSGTMKRGTEAAHQESIQESLVILFNLKII